MRFPYPTWSQFAKTKTYSAVDLVPVLSEHRRNGKTIATLNGSFDLLHAGHLYILYEASKTADLLVVALNTDASVKRYKNPSRPIIPLKERMEWSPRWLLLISSRGSMKATRGSSCSSFGPMFTSTALSMARDVSRLIWCASAAGGFTLWTASQASPHRRSSRQSRTCESRC